MSDLFEGFEDGDVAGAGVVAPAEPVVEKKVKKVKKVKKGAVTDADTLRTDSATTRNAENKEIIKNTGHTIVKILLGFGIGALVLGGGAGATYGIMNAKADDSGSNNPPIEQPAYQLTLTTENMNEIAGSLRGKGLIEEGDSFDKLTSADYDDENTVLKLKFEGKNVSGETKKFKFFEIGVQTQVATPNQDEVVAMIKNAQEGEITVSVNGGIEDEKPLPPPIEEMTSDMIKSQDYQAAIMGSNIGEATGFAGATLSKAEGRLDMYFYGVNGSDSPVVYKTSVKTPAGEKDTYTASEALELIRVQKPGSQVYTFGSAIVQNADDKVVGFTGETTSGEYNENIKATLADVAISTTGKYKDGETRCTGVTVLVIQDGKVWECEVADPSTLIFDGELNQEELDAHALACFYEWHRQSEAEAE